MSRLLVETLDSWSWLRARGYVKNDVSPINWAISKVSTRAESAVAGVVR
jgi:hypothetical protein